ncbi:MAG: hypothetical protein K2L45_00955 [Muribaculaceae bacterium]|nr:hypothetical protein [Muribaculaceae bacterium]
MEVFGFEWDGRSFPKNAQIKDWIRFISYDMIDDKSFHTKLTQTHRNFPDLSHPTKHRILFHWAYDAEPWNKEFEKIVIEYCDTYDLNVESNLRIFKSELKSEQSRRNSEINRRTETLFGFFSGGTESDWARYFASMAYNVHILGDYTNTCLDGLNDLNDLMGKIIKQMRNIDPQESKTAIKEINIILRNHDPIQIRASKLMDVLKYHCPLLLKKAKGGMLYNRIKNQGFVFKEIEEPSLLERFKRYVKSKVA